MTVLMHQRSVRRGPGERETWTLEINSHFSAIVDKAPTRSDEAQGPFALRENTEDQKPYPYSALNPSQLRTPGP
jgi:hypothetical protein